MIDVTTCFYIIESVSFVGDSLPNDGGLEVDNITLWLKLKFDVVRGRQGVLGPCQTP